MTEDPVLLSGMARDALPLGDVGGVLTDISDCDLIPISLTSSKSLLEGCWLAQSGGHAR